jgi:hypothetical protein
MKIQYAEGPASTVVYLEKYYLPVIKKQREETI